MEVPVDLSVALENIAKSRDIGRMIIGFRASLDGYTANEYVEDLQHDLRETPDPEGYVTSILVGLQHFWESRDLEWDSEVQRAADFVRSDKLDVAHWCS